MKISYNWLKEYIAIDETPERVAEILTTIGLEVEAMETVESIKGGLRGVVVGEVVNCERHPDADKLRVTKVNTGTGELLQIVCGAPNVAVGQKVPVATVGATLYFSSGEEIKIKRAKLRGVESMGMICAEDELGLGTGHEGIMVLDAAAPAGTPLHEWLAIESDTVFEIGLTPNRIDAASHIGVARDLAAFLNRDITRPSIAAFAEGTGTGIPVRVENTEACPRYTALTIRGASVQPSPEWLQRRLTAIGIRPINNVVDITNFVLHETGHPLHAFDADTIEGQEVVVRTCPDNTRMVTLDGEERVLSSQDLMICHTRQPMCIAGVFGGRNNSVTGHTTNIFLESAYFNPVWVRKTARRHGLSTDASFRYERGADPQATPWALKRAALLIQELAGGEIVGNIIDIYPNPIAPASVALSYAGIARLSGTEMDKDTIRRILQRLEFTIDSETPTGMQLTVPTCRVDVTRECDVVEELLRIYGYNRVEIPAHAAMPVCHAPQPDREKIRNTLSDYLVSHGFYEMMNNSLTKAEYYTPLQTFPEAQAVRILNPLSSDLNVMRQTLLFGGLESISRNINRQHADLQLFEWGNCYSFDPHRPDEPLKAYSETLQLGLFITGFTSPQSWHKPQERSHFFFLKGYVESLLARTGINPHRLETAGAPADLYADGMQYRWQGKTVATLGTVSKKQCRAFDIKQEVFAAEISAPALFQAAGSHKVLFRELPRFPEVRRDLALVLDEKVSYTQLHELARKTEKHLLLHIGLFDVYRGNKLPQGKKQYALSFVLQDREKTLTDQHIERIMTNLRQAFESTLGATLR
jgi:phenylalanyl-tRNA synthetase beta chain